MGKDEEIQLLRVQYAKGEISFDEYVKKLEYLNKNNIDSDLPSSEIHNLFDSTQNHEELYQKALKSYKDGDYTIAYDFIIKSLSINSESTRTWNFLGVVLTKKCDYQGAKDAFTRALLNDPGNVIAQRNYERLQKIINGSHYENQSEGLDPKKQIQSDHEKEISNLYTPPNSDINSGKNCEYCNILLSLPYTCRSCNKSFCLDHRLPQNHKCLYSHNWSNQSSSSNEREKPKH